MVWLFDTNLLDAQPRPLVGQTGVVTDVIFAADGTIVGSASLDGMTLLDAATGAQRAAWIKFTFFGTSYDSDTLNSAIVRLSW
jgi:hypothetical protein